MASWHSSSLCTDLFTTISISAYTLHLSSGNVKFWSPMNVLFVSLFVLISSFEGLSCSFSHSPSSNSSHSSISYQSSKDLLESLDCSYFLFCSLCSCDFTSCFAPCLIYCSVEEGINRMPYLP